MKFLRLIGSIAILGTTTLMHGATSYYDVRSQSVNNARMFSGFYRIRKDACDIDCSVEISTAYEQSFKPSNIGRCLFGSDLKICGSCEPEILIQGSTFNNGNRDPHAWLADYFGLPTDFYSTVSFKPTIRNAIADIGFWVNGPSWFAGMHVPVVNTAYHLNAHENIIDAGSLGYRIGYFTENAIDPTDLLTNAASFFNCGNTPDLGAGTTFQPLCCSRWSFSCDSKKLTRVADIVAIGGWNAVRCDEDWFDLYARLTIPTGNKPNSTFLFDPVVGNGGHWGLGIGVNANMCFWECIEKDQRVGLMLDAYAQHLFSTSQQRCFDLACKPNSRYMLAEQLGTTRIPPSLTGSADAGVEFQNAFAPVANITQSSIKTSYAVEGEVTARLIGESGNFQGAIGYNFWARSCERIRLKGACTLKNQQWALKGDAQVIGFRGDLVFDNPVRLAAVEAGATINAGTNNFPTGINGVPPQLNPGITNPVLAITTNPAGTGTEIVTELPSAGGQTNTSNPVVFITPADLDLRGIRGTSQKLFAHGSYVYRNGCNRFWPFVELGSEAEFGSSQCCTSDCKRGTPCTYNACKKTFTCNPVCKPQRSCQECALSKWAFWGILGVQF